MTPPFTVLLPVYHRDEPAHLRVAIDSVLHQTVPPDELLVVEDGNLSEESRAIVAEARRDCSDTQVRLLCQRRPGLGGALRDGTEHCTHDLVARMDADDIAVNDRFERQIKVLEQRAKVDVVGGILAEFQNDPDEIYAYRQVPTDSDAIAKLARYRNPLNHSTVTFRRDAVRAAGNYRPALGMEDYDLWVRMLQNGSTLVNLPRVLGKARIDEDYSRRGGLRLARAEIQRQWAFLRFGFIDRPTFVRNVVTRVGVRLTPGPIRGRLIRRFTREKSRRSSSQ